MTDAGTFESFQLSEVEAMLWEDADTELQHATAEIQAKYSRRVKAILAAHGVTPEHSYWFQRDPLVPGVFRCLYKAAPGENIPPALPCG